MQGVVADRHDNRLAIPYSVNLCVKIILHLVKLQFSLTEAHDVAHVGIDQQEVLSGTHQRGVVQELWGVLEPCPSQARQVEALYVLV